MRLLLLLSIACAKQPPSAAPAATESGPSLNMALPDDANASVFATLLLATPVTDWSPIDDRSFLYEALTFSGDGTFAARAALSAGGESVPCTESGQWTLEAVESGTAGTISMTLASTDCATRAAESSQRIRLSREGERYRISYR